MDVLLDTNILDRATLLNTVEYSAMKSYLEISNNSLIIPQVVHQEFMKHISKKAVESHRTLNSNYASQLDLISKIPSAAEIEKALVENYETFRRSIFVEEELTDVNFQDLLQRSLNEVPPFKSKGQGFRDVVIWLTIIKYLEDNEDKTVAFITNNTKDFGDTILFPELTLELESKGLADRLKYYNRLADFLEEHSKKIEFITYDFVENALSGYIESYGTSMTEEGLDVESPNLTDDWEVVDIDWAESKIENYYIISEDESYFFVNVDVAFYFRVIFQGMKTHIQYTITGDPDWIQQQVMDVAYKTKMKEYVLMVNKSNKSTKLA